MKKLKSAKFLSLLLISSLLILIGSSLLAPQVKADEATFGLVRLDRMKVNTATGGTVCLQPSADDITVTTISVSFDNSFTLGDHALFVANDDNLPVFGGTPATVFPGIDGIVPADIVGQTVIYTVASTSLDHTVVYCFNFGAGLTTGADPGSDLTGDITTNGDPGETAVYAVATISEDRIGVTATVPQIFNFALPDTSIALGTLSITAVSSDAVTATLGTNAKGGWVSWVRNSTAGLWSTSQGVGIAVPTGAYPTVYDLALTTGYVLDVDAGDGPPTIDAAYDGDDTNSGGIMEDSFHQMAYKATPGSADTFIINLRAKVTNIQLPATDYADTLTIAAAGEF